MARGFCQQGSQLLFAVADAYLTQRVDRLAECGFNGVDILTPAGSACFDCGIVRISLQVWQNPHG